MLTFSHYAGDHFCSVQRPILVLDSTGLLNIYWHYPGGDMDRLYEYIESLIAERTRVEGEIARLEGMLRTPRPGARATRRKTVGREGLPAFSEGVIVAPSSRQPSDRF